MELRRRRRAVPPRLRGAADPPCPSLRPRAGGAHVGRRAAAASDHSGLRIHAASAAPSLPARRRPGRRQDHHGGAAHQGADRPRRPSALSGRLSRQPRRAVAGRALPPVPSAVRHPDERQARSGAHRQLVPGSQSRHRPARQALPQRGCAAEAASAGLPLGPRRVRRGAQDVGHLLRRRGQVHEALSAGPACCRVSPATSS